MLDNTILFICIILVLILVILYKNKIDNFQTKAQTINEKCEIDEDCKGPGTFCYMGTCWAYWQGQPMPWNNCAGPCNSVDPNVNCSANPGKCSPYCKCKPNRRPGGSIGTNCFPVCGTPCERNSDCSAGCPACVHGICSSPNKPIPVL